MEILTQIGVLQKPSTVRPIKNTKKTYQIKMLWFVCVHSATLNVCVFVRAYAFVEGAQKKVSAQNASVHK